MKKLIALASVLAFLGCKEDKQSQPPTTAKAVPQAEPAKPDKTKADAPKPTLELPAISLDPVSADKVKLAKSKNSAALAKQKAGDFTAAAALYREALAADPGHIFARYNLATALSLAGDGDGAIAILAELGAATDCSVCAGRLVRAKSDKDFASLEGNETFKKLVSSVKSPELSVEAAAKLALTELANSNTFPTSILHPRNSVKVETTNGNCDPGDGEDCKSTATLAGAEEVEKFFEDSFPVEVELGSCDKTCCKTKQDPDAQVGDMSMTINEMCFSTDSGGVTTLVSLKVQEG